MRVIVRKNTITTPDNHSVNESKLAKRFPDSEDGVKQSNLDLPVEFEGHLLANANLFSYMSASGAQNKKNNITIYGTGYLGLVTAAVLADTGNYVLCMDTNENKISNLKKGIIPVFEPGLDRIVSRNIEARRLTFTSDKKESVTHSGVQIVTVGCPVDENGSADIQYVVDVAEIIGEHMESPKIIVIRSTVPVGTGDFIQGRIADILYARNLKTSFAVISNPDFFKQGSAVNDCEKPDRIIIGSNDAIAVDVMRQLYKPFYRDQRSRFIVMDRISAELTKYAADAFLATKISYMNELSNIAERLGADIEEVRSGIGPDPRIGYDFIHPGCGYGGSNLPKDVRGLISTAETHNVNSELLTSVDRVNDRQRAIMFERLMYHFNNDIKDKTFAIWGLSFKPNTDDLREAPSRIIIESIIEHGGNVRAYDPVAMHEFRSLYPNQRKVELWGTCMDAVENSDALLICTEWHEFLSPNFDLVIRSLKYPLVVDGRNLYSPTDMIERGFIYESIGRSQATRQTSPLDDFKVA